MLQPAPRPPFERGRFTIKVLGRTDLDHTKQGKHVLLLAKDLVLAVDCHLMTEQFHLQLSSESIFRQRHRVGRQIFGAKRVVRGALAFALSFKREL